MGNYIDDLEVFNPLLTDWLIEYNCSLLANQLFKGRDKVKSGFNRPHQRLGYLTPMEFLEMKKEKNLAGKVLPMCPTRTGI